MAANSGGEEAPDPSKLVVVREGLVRMNQDVTDGSSDHSSSDNSDKVSKVNNELQQDNRSDNVIGDQAPKSVTQETYPSSDYGPFIVFVESNTSQNIGLLEILLCVTVIATLLVVGGIGKNPGPNQGPFGWEELEEIKRVVKDVRKGEEIKEMLQEHRATQIKEMKDLRIFIKEETGGVNDKYPLDDIVQLIPKEFHFLFVLSVVLIYGGMGIHNSVYSIDEALIELVRSKPMLYDISSSSYSDKVAKRNAWQDIAVHLKLEGEDGSGTESDEMVKEDGEETQDDTVIIQHEPDEVLEAETQPTQQLTIIMGFASIWMTVLLVSFLSTGNYRELYTALADMEELLETEAVLMRSLEGYVAAQEEKLRLLRRHYEEYARKHQEASRDVQGYLSNPINAYLLVKRLTTDWKAVESQMVNDVGSGFVEKITSYRAVLKFPADEDLMRLQDTYKLDISSLARGELNGIQNSTELSEVHLLLGADVLGKLLTGVLIKLDENMYALETSTDVPDLDAIDRKGIELRWRYLQKLRDDLRQRFRKEYLALLIQQGGRTSNKVNVGDVVLIGADDIKRADWPLSVVQEVYPGNVKTTLKSTDELLEILPGHQRGLDTGNKEYYLKDMEEKESEREHKKGDDGENDVLADVPYIATEQKPQPKTKVSEQDMCKMLCRNEVSIPVEIWSKLKCRYVDMDVPFLKLARLKEEEAYLKPRIVIYHDVIYDSEIETIKRLAQPRLFQSTVYKNKTGKYETSTYRISKSAWLKEEDHPHVSAVNQRVADMTNLNVKTAEELHVGNYGIGGYYGPHTDYFEKRKTNPSFILGTGNRIATVLFYLNDVPQGGATVFPVLKVALWPKKGSAAFWYNLYKSGDGDVSTTHAACPVLAGSKWGK
ncbi:prolyl 4-hydroxylase subunit alpha-1-like [Anabrus simplex]|uniref:prolyl 4-hydroxylase subunit alpha-1-like n=1 Tax=Anabrus simplex TaxID=316456 RepID=UPI0035A2759D